MNQERLDALWHLALHCRMFVFAQAQLERLGLMETGGAPAYPVEANYHQFAAMHALSVLCVVDRPRRGYLHHALEALALTPLGMPAQAILDELIAPDIPFGEALLVMRNRERTHGNLFRPSRMASRAADRRAGQIVAALQVVDARERFNDCWHRMAGVLETLADELEREMERVAPPEPTGRGFVMVEHMPRRGGPLGQLRMPRQVLFMMEPLSVEEILVWRLKPR